jgi:hypothetical protein
MELSGSLLASQVLNLLRSAVEPVVGDLARRFHLTRTVRNASFSEESPIIQKAIKDLEIVLGHQALVTEEVAALLEELRQTGYFSRLARDAFFQIDDPGIRLKFEVLFDRVVQSNDDRKHDKCQRLYNTLRSIMRESLRRQFRPDLLFLVDTRNIEAGELDKWLDRKLFEIREKHIMPEGTSARGILLIDEQKRPVSFFRNDSYPSWLRMDPAQLKNVIAEINEGLERRYDKVRLEGPSFQSITVKIDDVFMPLRLLKEQSSRPESGVVDLAIEELQQPLSLVILGDPGAGKSTIVQKYCFDEVRGARSAKVSRLAIKLDVRLLADFLASNKNTSIFDFISAEIVNQSSTLIERRIVDDILRYLIFFGMITIAFDGIDEIVNVGARRRLLDGITQFSRTNSDCSFLFTCRITDFRVTPFSGTNICYLPRLRPPQIEAYYRSASNFAFRMDSSTIERNVPVFMRESQRNAGEFVSLPLLLTLIVWIFNLTKRIPDNRYQIYKECAELLFKRWDALKDIDSNIPDEHWLFGLVSHIAKRLYLKQPEEGNPDVDWLKGVANEFFHSMYEVDKLTRSKHSSERFVALLAGRSWVLEEKQAGIYEFTHRTFMEYFFAQWLVDEHGDPVSFLNHVRSRIEHGEWYVPNHLALQLFCAGKIQLSGKVCDHLLHILQQNEGVEGPYRNVLNFVSDATLYLLPTERNIMAIANYMTNIVRDASEWNRHVAQLLSTSREMSDALVEGVYQAFCASIATKGAYRLGYVLDWLYLINLNQELRIGGKPLPYMQALQPLQSKILRKLNEDVSMTQAYFTSLPKILFDLARTVDEANLQRAGLAIWDASIRDNRYDWRYVDFCLALVEFIEFAKAKTRVAPIYAELMVLLAHSGISNCPQQIVGGTLVTSEIPGLNVHSIATLESLQADDTRAGAVLALMGMLEVYKRLSIESSFANQCARTLTEITAQLSTDHRMKIVGNRWLTGEFRLFRHVGVVQVHAITG